jgi:hypothetical protein
VDFKNFPLTCMGTFYRVCAGHTNFSCFLSRLSANFLIFFVRTDCLNLYLSPARMRTGLTIFFSNFWEFHTDHLYRLLSWSSEIFGFMQTFLCFTFYILGSVFLFLIFLICYSYCLNIVWDDKSSMLVFIRFAMTFGFYERVNSEGITA